MAQIPSSPSTKKISDLVGMIKRGELILQPSFQRKLVWNPKHKEAFIETILKGYPFPEIYIAQSGIDLKTLQSEQVVVDGQQRLSTIVNYIEGADFCRTIPCFQDLDEAAKKEFLAYDVVVRDLKDASEDTIKEVFRRINQTQYSLSEIEINNAVYEGAFISTAKEILESITAQEFPIFSDTEISRMADLDYILMIMATIQGGGYFAGNKETGSYITKYDDCYDESERMKSRVLKTFENINSLKLKNDSIWYRKSNFFTLFVETTLKNVWPENMKERLESFEDLVLANKDNKDNDYGIYYDSMYTGTNSRSSRLRRAELFDKYCLS